jgi:hypothetical protein
MNHKVGDTVRIRSREWIDAQEKDKDGNICGEDGCYMTSGMQQQAGKIAHIAKAYVRVDRYGLDIDDGRHFWDDWMFDPDYQPPDEPLSCVEAVVAMVSDGEILQHREYQVEEKWDGKEFVYRIFGEQEWHPKPLDGNFVGLRRAKRKRPMTRWEILAWANSEASREWVVMDPINNDWCVPQSFRYINTRGYRRARLLPDLSGVDESTICGFEAEE